jgi:hypothetical protein
VTRCSRGCISAWPGQPEPGHLSLATCFMPMVPDLSYRADPRKQLQLARDAGFTCSTCRTCMTAPTEDPLVAEWDAHPNGRAHAMMADMLYNQLRGEERAMLSCDGGRRCGPLGTDAAGPGTGAVGSSGTDARGPLELCSRVLSELTPSRPLGTNAVSSGTAPSSPFGADAARSSWN